MRINHLFIAATDVEKSTQFYNEFLGFVPTRRFNDGAGDSQIVHREVQGRDFDLLIVPIESKKLPYGHHISFETDTAEEFEALLQKAKKLELKPRSQVPLNSEPGTSQFSMYGKTYEHFYVLDPSWVNVEVMFKVS